MQLGMEDLVWKVVGVQGGVRRRVQLTKEVGIEGKIERFNKLFERQWWGLLFGLIT